MKPRPQDIGHARKQKARTAISELKKRSDFPRLHVDAMTKAESAYKAADVGLFSRAAGPSKARLEYSIKLLDIWAAAYVQLVSNLEEQQLFMDYLNGLGQNSWEIYRGNVLVILTPDQHKEASTAIGDRVIYWEKESWSRLVMPESDSKQTTENEAPLRRGYRAEVRAWMKDHGISSVEVAAKRLAVGYDSLKSIMSDKGTPRYGPDMLKAVLEKISPRTGE